MTESRGSKRTTLRLAGVEAEVSLVKVSGTPKAAKYETRKVSADPERAEMRRRVAQAEREAFRTDPFAAAGGLVVGRPTTELHFAKGEVREDGVPFTMQHGVTGPGGEWVDLTERLAEVDRANTLDGIEVLFTVNAASVPRTLVRDSYYVVPAGEGGAAAVLQRVAAALSGTRLGAVVRWTKRTSQALGMVIAAPNPVPAHMRAPADAADLFLALVELEWPENVRPVPAKSWTAADSLPASAVMPARNLMDALYRPADAIYGLRDERTAQRAELLEAAREGREWLPPEPERVAGGVVDAFAAALADVQ